MFFFFINTKWVQTIIVFISSYYIACNIIVSSYLLIIGVVIKRCNIEFEVREGELNERMTRKEE